MVEVDQDSGPVRLCLELHEGIDDGGYRRIVQHLHQAGRLVRPLAPRRDIEPAVLGQSEAGDFALAHYPYLSIALARLFCVLSGRRGGFIFSWIMATAGFAGVGLVVIRLPG